MDRFLNVVTVFSLLLIAVVLGSVRREHIRVEYSVSWLVAGVALFVLSRWRALEQWIGASLGVNDAPLPRSAHPLHWDPKAGARVR